jgi:hypothetical protein
MKIVSIEPTPSPNSMKLNMDQALSNGKTYNFNSKSKEGAPDYIQKLLAIEGVTGIFQVTNFIAIERNSKADWKAILPQVRDVFEENTAVTDNQQSGQEPADEAFGEVQVFIQIFKGIPMQIKLTSGSEEARVGLPERFMNAAMKAESSSANLVMERKWEEQGIRYGDLQEVGNEIAEEISATYDDERLERLVAKAFEKETDSSTLDEAISSSIVVDRLDDPDWKVRYAALERMKLTENEIPVLEKALNDSKTSIRRLATAYLGDIGGTEALPLLYKALKDKSAVVRRTAGDALSDVGDPVAIEAMTEALQDSNKLVRWRAARFLFEVGDETAIGALRKAQDDEEFEVSLQVKIALERIEGGEAAEGSIWQQMTKGLAEKGKKEE